MPKNIFMISPEKCPNKLGKNKKKDNVKQLPVSEAK